MALLSRSARAAARARDPAADRRGSDGRRPCAPGPQDQGPRQAPRARATSRSSTTPTSTGSPPRTWSRAECGRSSTSPSSTGRYPNPGPLLLARAGVRLIDVAGRAAVRGARATATGGDRRRRGSRATAACWPRGRVIDLERRDRADRGPARADRRGARPTSPRTRSTTCARRASCWPGRIELPPVRTDFRDRHALIVVRGHHLSQGPAHAARLHPGHAPGAGRGRRRRRRDPRGGLHAGHDPRRHGLGERRGAHLRRRAGRPRLLRRPRARAASASSARPRARSSRRRSAPARTSRCCSRTRRAPS